METTFTFPLDASLSIALKVNETKPIEEIANGKVFCFNNTTVKLTSFTTLQ